MSYRAPVAEILFTLRHVAGLGGVDPEDAQAILTEAGRLAADVLAPLNRVGDRHGTPFAAGRVTTPPGWRDAYATFTAGGWNGLSADPDYGGQGLPKALDAACAEMWNGANLAFGLCPLLTQGGIEALATHGSEELKARYLDKLVSGEWPATMNLTESQAGSDLALLRTRAEPVGDGTYRITGAKIYITYGEHDLSENIVHLVLARLKNAPAGTRGISLFLVPKILQDGSANDLRCSGIEHKLGINASPTCSMAFGDDGGATGWLIGQENKGLACMFTMMNAARLMVGVQGVGVAEAATQKASAYAAERRQGKAIGAAEATSPIIAHPDVQRMLLTMKAYTAAARGICYLTAAALDAAHGPEGRAAHDRASLLTPVAKAFSTDLANEVTSLGVQVHGGMGFVEETGAAQFMRDARILGIYEGTNGIQAIDLTGRKLPLNGGATVRAQIAWMRRAAEGLLKSPEPAFGHMAARLRGGVESLDRATSHQLAALASNRPEAALAGAAPYLRLFGLTLGGACLARTALAAAAARKAGETDPAHAGRIALARFYAENLLPASGGLEEAVLAGGSFTEEAALALAV
ncbi:acyl-CoA dehydrogenase [Methylobacterium persicinum]|uniref:Alkylation response protein AidB-like acyl-CoA dehydrogenase n=1 Tax=Methylobacterium persicinum TaxID=374426 RepID=A0ABU0HS92_9HYPH|nr:acyl-CoA dehydrogenase [Methylobacterium persicinum]MDQ0444777.1 alkylation response protein AidB-like acyl-CoA dehydrogenase [Methylobacterium persicinum]GJE38120.1 3-methylmercaptopropionyl-CoA dehydrogenase [Methylobacterium persicinum]